jgi:hypothetical protein
MALEYAYKLRERFPQTLVFWIQANDPENFEKGFATIAKAASLPGVGLISKSESLPGRIRVISVSR